VTVTSAAEIFCVLQAQTNSEDCTAGFMITDMKGGKIVD